MVRSNHVPGASLQRQCDPLCELQELGGLINDSEKDD